MLDFDESFVDASAPNAAAIKNGRALVLKGKFSTLHKDADETVLFGTCKGSGKTPYACSADFARPDQPVHRCSCPSRQFPCKHCLGLLYAFVQGKPFTVAEVPADILDKRDKAEARAEKKAERAKKPKKVDKKALAKKLDAQLEGLDLLERMVHDLVRLGMGNTNAKTAARIEEQAKQLQNAFLPGAQSALQAYTLLFSDEEGRFDGARSAAARERIYGEALDQLTRLHALIRQGRKYLETRKADPELAPDTDSAIAAWLGHAWQLTELEAAGRMEADVELVQLAFHSHDDRARREYVDTGIWMVLSDGRIVRTQTFRPYKAAQFIKSEDSFFGVAQIPALYVYPGGPNPRVRWERMVPRAATAADVQRVRGHAVSTFGAAVKSVKGTLKAPLNDRHPVLALAYARFGRVGGELCVEDSAGDRLLLTDDGMRQEPASCHLLEMLPQALLTDQVLIARFRHDLDTRELRIKPLAIAAADGVVRLTF